MKPRLHKIFKFAVAALGLLFCSAANGQTPAIDSLQKIIARGRRDSLEVRAYLALSDHYSRTNLALAKQNAWKAATIARQNNLAFQTSLAYAMLVTLNVQINQTDSAKYYLALIDQLAVKTGNDRIRVNYDFAAGLFYRKQGNYKASQPFMLAVLKDYTKRNAQLDMAGQSLNIGNNYGDMGEYRNAVTYHLKALTLFTELGNKRGMSFSISSIGSDLIKVGQFAAALPYIQRSLTLKTALKDERGIAASYISLGEIQEGLRQYDQALASYRKALEMDKAMKLTIEEAKADFNIAKVHADQDHDQAAMAYFDRSRELFRQLGDTAYLAAVNAEVASMQNHTIRQKTAEKTFRATLATAIRMGDKNTEISNYKYLADLYARNKQFERALAFNEKYHNESDSVNNEDLQLQVQALQQQFNIEKKEKEISLLKKSRQLDQVTLQKQKLFKWGTAIFLLMLIAIGFLILNRYKEEQQHKRLVEIEKMRNQIARNLHDDIGSTLSSINILSKVALKQAGGDEKVQAGLEKIKDSSFAIMESMSDIVWAINPGNDPLEKTILRMREFAASILEPAGIDLSFREEGKLSGLTLDVDVRKNLYLIFKEAVNNVAKYSKATLTKITLHQNGHRFVLTITDNGQGFDSSGMYGGNGLKNMRIRAVEMKAEFEIESKPAVGTQITIAIPIT